MKSIRKRNRMIMLVILLLLISIGFAFVNTNLKIIGTANVLKQTWEIHFENVEVTDGSITPISPATINPEDPTKVSYSINLNDPGDFYEFTVDAVNEGSINAMIGKIDIINTVTENSNTTSTLPNYIKYSVKYADGRDVEEKHILKSGKTKKYKVRIEFRKDINASDLENIKALNLNLKFEVTYTQATKEAINIDCVEVELDPNGGTLPESEGWTGSGESATKELSEDDPYGQIPTPTREGYTFLGWVGSSEGSLDNSYEELEYIESTGTQYIDVEYVPKMDTRIELDMLLIGNFKPCSTYSGSNIIFGVADQNGQWFSANFGEEDYQAANMFVWNDSINDLEKSRFDVSGSTIYNRNTFILDSDSVTYGEYTKTINPKNGNQLTSMYLFGCNSKSYDYEGPFTSYGMRVYGLKVYESNILVRDYVPAINTTTKHIGMYEKLTNRFVGNIGTKEFKTVYTTSTSRVKSQNSHKLIALWEEQ